MKKILFLDDKEERWRAFQKRYDKNEVWTYWVITAKEAISALEIRDFDEVWLDHDLGGKVFVDSNREDCGMEVVRWIVEHKPKIEEIMIHTWNAPAGMRMSDALDKAGYYVIYRPFGIE